MNKTPSSKSIIANFALSTAEADQAPAPRPRSQPVARVGAGVIGATQRTLSDIRDERDRLQALVAAGGGLELDPTVIDPSPFPDRLPDDGQCLRGVQETHRPGRPEDLNSGPDPPRRGGPLSDRLWPSPLAGMPRPWHQGKSDPDGADRRRACRGPGH